MENRKKIEKIKVLFNEAERKHRGIFTETGKNDPEWPLWFAEHMKDQLEKVVERHFTVGELVYLLTSAENSHKKYFPESEWLEYYANYLLEKHSQQKTSA